LNICLLPTEASRCARIPKTRSIGVSVLRVTKQDIFTRENHFSLNGTPGTPCHHSTSHPGASSHEDTPPRDLSLSHVPAIGTPHGERPGSILQQDLSSRLIIDPAWSTRPHHTPKTYAKISPSSLSGYYQVNGTSCLISNASHSPASHHRYNASKSKAEVTGNIAASNLAAG
jgi:hypothetical protein